MVGVVPTSPYAYALAQWVELISSISKVNEKSILTKSDRLAKSAAVSRSIKTISGTGNCMV